MALDTVLRFSFPVKSDNKDEENKDMERVITVNKHVGLKIFLFALIKNFI
jgi:hypothetical protein